MRKALVNVNGQFLANPDDPAITVYDRSFMYGDSIYEVIRTYSGKSFGLDLHLDRLKRSAELGYFKLPHKMAYYAAECERTIKGYYERFGTDLDVYCRIVLSRGAGSIGFSSAKAKGSELYAIIVQPLQWPDEATVLKGVSIAIAGRDSINTKALSREIKSGNYLSHILGFIEAEERGYSDAIFLNSEGFLSEGTTFNIFYVKNGILCTPKLESGILHGITRKMILDLAPTLGLETREVWMRTHHLLEADEIFLSSSTKEIWPINRVEKRVYFTKDCPPWTAKIRTTLHQRILRSLGTYP